MQKITSLILKSFAVVLLLTACKKNQSDEDYQETPQPVIPVFTEKVNSPVSGFIMDEQSRPVAGAVVTAGTAVVSTDEFGYFEIVSSQQTKNIGFIKVTRPGYFTGFKTFVAKAGEPAFVRTMLLTKTAAGTISSGNGGTVTTTDGATVTLPANAVVDAGSGVVYNGVVSVSVRVLPLNAESDRLFSVPGDARGINTDGHLKSLNMHAAIAVDLNGDAGQKLQLAAAARATVSMPVDAALQSKAPATTTLWSLDEEKGIWKEEGTLTKSGNHYTGQVSHFSFWSGATGLSLVNFTAQVLNTSLQPLANVAVLISMAGQPFNAGYGKFAFTDVNGFVSGGIPANSSFELNVLTTCSNQTYSHYFTTTASDIDLGAITGNLGQAMVTISGTAANCNGQPVTNGYVQTYDNGFYNRIPVVNGSFNFTGLACNNVAINYVLVDNSTYQQNSPQTITLVPGNNNLGALSACGISTLGAISYTIDGITRTYTEPVDTLAGFYISGGITTIVKLSGSLPAPGMSFQFNGGTALGNGHTVTDVWSEGFPTGRGYAPVPLNVTITEFGDAGGFIAGTFSGLLLDFTNNTPHNVSYSFRIKRRN